MIMIVIGITADQIGSAWSCNDPH